MFSYLEDPILYIYIGTVIKEVYIHEKNVSTKEKTR